jgi:hypothetical protein
VSARGPFGHPGPVGPPDPGEFHGIGHVPSTGSPSGRSGSGRSGSGYPDRSGYPGGAGQPSPGFGQGAAGSYQRPESLTSPGVPSRPALPPRSDRTPTTPFGRYAALLRQLDQVRAGDEAMAESWRRSADSMNAVAEEIGPIIMEHSQQLEMLARRLRMRVMHLGAQKITEEIDPVEALDTAKDLTNQTAFLANEAKRLGSQAAFLPTWRPAYRNFLVYLACAVVTGILQYALFLLHDNNPSSLVILFLLPFVSWVTGLTLIRYYGQPAIPPDPATRRQQFRVGMPPPPDPMTRSPRLGILLCLGTFPIWYLGVVANSWLG